MENEVRLRLAMTSDLRAQIRAARDVRARRLAELYEIVERERGGDVLCGYCGEPLPVSRVGNAAQPARYCSSQHRKYAWRQTDSGKECERAAWRRQTARRRAATA